MLSIHLLFLHLQLIIEILQNSKGVCMKINFYFLSFLITSNFVFAGSLDSVNVGPGVIHYHEVIDAGPWNINILSIDLHNEWLKFQSVKSGDKLTAFEKTSSSAARNSYEGHKVVGAINGDFYNTSTGEQIGSQIVNGELLKVTNDWLNIAFDINNNPLIGMQNFSGSIITSDSIKTISGINRIRATDEMIFYNSFMGNSTSSNQYGTEVRLLQIDNWLVNDTIRCVVDTLIANIGNLQIGKGNAVLSGHGVSSAFLINNFHKGDTVKIVLTLSPAFPQLEQLIGGNTWLVKNGVANSDNGDRHPRTSIGFNLDTTKIFLFSVDGRQAGLSVGMSYKELGDYMIKWGVYQGLNLDGGGSTTMVVRDKIVNSPSDIGGERSVANSLLLISTAPTGSLAHLRINPNEVFLIKGSTMNFSASGFDEHFNPVNISSGSLTWNCETLIGTVSQSGVFTAANDTITGYIYAGIGEIKDSALIHLTKVSKIILEPNPVILQVGQSQQMKATASDNYNNGIQLSQSKFNWSVLGAVGTITSGGYFAATNTGIGEIFAEYDSIKGSVPLTVGTAATMIIDDFSNPSGYTLSGTKVNLAGCSFTPDNSIFVSPSSSGRLNYSLTTGGTSALYLAKIIPISGTPEKLSIQIYGDGKKHWLRGEFADKDNEKFIINFTSGDPGIEWMDSWQFIEVNLKDAVPSWANPSAVLSFPIQWTRLYLAETSDTKKDDGSICIDDFRAHFTSTGTEDVATVLPDDFKLFQNYPNPFNPSTAISFGLPERTQVVLSVYNQLGEKVAVLINGERESGYHGVEWNAANLPSGIYFYQLKTGKYRAVKKLLLMK